MPGGSRPNGPLLVILIAYFVVLLVPNNISERVELEAMWHQMGVPAVGPTFLDLRAVTSSWDCTRLGQDVIHANPCDPYERPFSYPRIWTAPSALGLGEDDTMWIGALLALLFLGITIWFVGDDGFWPGIIVGLTIISPTVMLAIERGNVDLLMYALVMLAAVFVARSALLAALPLIAAGILKLYPVFAFSAIAARRTLRSATIVAASLLGLGIYVVSMPDDLRLIVARPNETGVVHNYGAGVLAEIMKTDLASISEFFMTPAGGRAVYLAVLAIGVTGAVVLWRRSGRELSATLDPIEPVRKAAFVMGTSIFCGTYALGHHIDYRLIFLLLTLPGAFRLASASGPARRVGIALVGSVFGTSWLSPLPDHPMLEVVNLVIFVILLGCLLALATENKAALRAS